MTDHHPKDAANSPRPPSATLVVDANVILSAGLGSRSRPIFDRVVASRDVVTTARAAAEIRGVLKGAPFLPPGATARARALLADLPVVDETFYAERLTAAERVLERAPASRNGSTDDAHLLACAWTFDADIWSHDRDFAGTGWPSWSNVNLSESLRSDPAQGANPDDTGSI